MTIASRQETRHPSLPWLLVGEARRDGLEGARADGIEGGLRGALLHGQAEGPAGVPDDVGVVSGVGRERADDGVEEPRG